MGDSPSAGPHVARIVESILAEMGVEEHDDRVTRQLLELLYRYVWSVLDDARMYSDHADKPAIDIDDVKLAIRTRVHTSFSQPPPRAVAMQIASERNKEPLPPVDLRAGVALPHPDLQLTKQNVSVVFPSDESGSAKPPSGSVGKR